jgi:DNA-binding transcriptional ArsR family regulator
MSFSEPVLSPMVLDKKLDINVLTSEQLDKASIILKAIAHPMRIAILNQLDGGKELSVTEIHEALGIEQSATSHHLGILKDKGVLASRRDGKNTYYFIRHENLLGIVDCISKCACF